MTQYDSLRLRNLEPLSMSQKEHAYFLLREGTGIEMNAAMTYLRYTDERGRLFPSARRQALKSFSDLEAKAESPELKEVLQDNVLYLTQQETPFVIIKEFAAAGGIILLNLLFPLSFKIRREPDF